MRRQDGVKGIRYKEVCVFRIGLMHVYYLVGFYYLLLFVIHMLSLDKLKDLLMYLSVTADMQTPGRPRRAPTYMLGGQPNTPLLLYLHFVYLVSSSDS